MNAPLAEATAHYPLRTALIEGDRSWTWQELYREAASRAELLRREYGIQHGDTVATLLGNVAEHAILLHAIWLAGAAVAPLNTRLLDIERDRQLELLRPALLIQDDAAAAPDEILDVTAVSIDALPERVGDGVSHEGDFAYSQHCSILFTSGSSGTPKAVPHNWSHHRASAEASARNLGVRDDDNWQCVIPLYHIGGLAVLTRGVLHGMATTLHAGFDPHDVLEAFEKHTVTITSLVPTMLHRMLQTDRAFNGSRYPRLRAILLGGAPSTEALRREVRERTLPVLPTYGLTESCSQVVTASPDAACTHTSSAGKALEGVELRICDEDGTALPSGTEGEIFLRGPILTTGYLYHKGLNAARFARGWFHTGDMGVLEADGCLRVLSRREDMIVSGGENIYPAEITTVLLAHPDVLDAAAVGVEDEEWGQRPCAAVVLAEEVSVEQLSDWCREHLAAYKVPRHWRVVEALPRTQAGKLISGEVRKLFSRETI